MRSLIDKQFIPFAKHEVEQSIQRRFAGQVREYPDKIAIKTKDSTLTYDQLDRTSSRIANTILAEIGQGEEPVALLTGAVDLQIASMLGTLKAGKFYVPIDTAHINSRDRRILNDCGARLLITDSMSLELVKSLSGESARILIVDLISEATPDGAPGVTALPDQIVYVLYTSGSTGEPKGVIQTHRNVLHNIMKYTNGIHISADDRLLLVASCSVGASVSDIYGALLNGGSLFPLDLRR